MPGILFLLSDFGYSDCYAAQMKAAVLSFCGDDPLLVDLTHSVTPGSVREGAFHLMTTVPRLPGGSVVLAVVDPGVGTSRRGIAASVGDLIAIGPDNGLLSWLDARDTRYLPAPDPGASTTFHGRDWFAPMAARFLVNPGWFGLLEPCPAPVTIPRGVSAATDNGIRTEVAHVDHFGNCILWAGSDLLDGFTPGFVRAGARRFPAGRSGAYDPSGGSLLVIPGSMGLVEVAVPRGRADSLLGVAAGDEIVLEIP